MMYGAGTRCPANEVAGSVQRTPSRPVPKPVREVWRMSSLNAAASTFKSERPAPDPAALIAPETWQDPGLLLIGEKKYGFRCYPGHPPAGCTRIVRLFQGDGFADETYDVSFHTDRPPLCTCPDHVFRRKDETGDSCKHVRACEALELDRATVPVREVDGVPDLLASDLELIEDPNEAPF